MTRKHKLATATVLLGLGLGAAWAGEKPCRAPQETTYPQPERSGPDPFPTAEATTLGWIPCSVAPGKEAIAQQLLAPVSLDYQDTPLPHILADLQEMTGVNIVLDTDALAEASVDLDAPVTVQVENVPLKSALNTVLAPIHLTFGVKVDCVQITTPVHGHHATPPGTDLIIHDPIGPATSDIATDNAAIERRLSAIVDLCIKNAPLRDVVQTLRAVSGVNVVLDTAALEDAAISQEQPVSLDIEHMSLKSALNILLKQAHLTYVIKDEALQITPEECAKGKLKTVTYQVADIVVPLSGCGEDLLPAFCRTDADVVASHKPGQTCEEALIRLITSTIDPASWTDHGGKCTIQYFPVGLAIVVTQTADVHERIAELLASLRATQEKEDREYQLISKFVELRPDGKCKEEFLPRVTFVRGPFIGFGVGRTVVLNEGSIHDLIHDDGFSQGPNKQDGIHLGTTLKARLTAAEEGGLRLDVTFQKSDLVEANEEGLHASGHYHRLVKRVQPGKPVKLVLSQDEDGTARKWVEFTVNEVASEEEEQVFLGNLPPMPR